LSSQPEYGPLGRVGLIVPPGNTTIEPELHSLVPDGVALYATRLPGRVSRDTSVGLKDRFVEYNGSLQAAANSFGSTELDALCYGVTGSCYLAGVEGERKLIEDLRVGGAKRVTTAARAITELLRAFGSRRLGIVSPYPEWVTELAIAYWEASGFDVAQVVQLSNVVSLYEVAIDEVLGPARAIEKAKVDIILLSGTGVPTLRAVEQLSQELSIPVTSSNLSLGWWLSQNLPGAYSCEPKSRALRSLQGWAPTTTKTAR
jgi:maleate isomerase